MYAEASIGAANDGEPLRATDPMKKALIVSPHFPPATVAGVHRARHMAKHLPAFGWDPTIVRVQPEFYTERLDHGLSSLVPDTVKQVHTAALPTSVMRRFGIGDIGLRALPYLARAIRDTITHEKTDLVFLTGSPFYPLLLSAFIKRHFDVPVVADLQDPWVSKFGDAQPFFSKRRFSNRIAKLFEPIALKHADAVTSVSDVQNSELRARYSFLSDIPMRGIPIGGDPEDFRALRDKPPQTPLLELDSRHINLNYVGTFLPRAKPLARMVFKGLRRLVNEHSGLAEKLRLNFVGTSNQPADVKDTPVSRLAAEEGVGHLVTEVPRRVDFLEALFLLSSADGLLMIGSDEPHYTASKIYPNLMAHRPYLSFFHAQSSSHEILSAAKGGVCLSFQSLEELGAMEQAVADGLKRLALEPSSFAPVDQSLYHDYTAQAVAGQYADLFDLVAS